MRDIKERAIEATKTKKKESKKRERDNTTILLLKDPHLCFKVALVLHREFSYHSCITMWGSLHYRTWLVYSNDEPPQKSSRSSWESKLDAPPLVPLESIHILIALCASVAWQSLLLTSYLSLGFLSPMIVSLAYDCPHWCEPFSLFHFLSPSFILFAILSAN